MQKYGGTEFLQSTASASGPLNLSISNRKSIGWYRGRQIVNRQLPIDQNVSGSFSSFLKRTLLLSARAKPTYIFSAHLERLLLSCFCKTQLSQQIMQHLHYQICRTPQMIFTWQVHTLVLGASPNAAVGRVTPRAIKQHCHHRSSCSVSSLLPARWPAFFILWNKEYSLLVEEGRWSCSQDGIRTGPAASGGELFSWMPIMVVCPCAVCGWGRDGAVVTKSGGWTDRCGGERSVRTKRHWPLSITINDRCWGRWVKGCLQSPLATSKSFCTECYKVVLVGCFHSCCSLTAKTFSISDTHSAVADQRSRRANVLPWCLRWWTVTIS